MFQKHLFARRLRDFRNKAGESQATVANLLKVSPNQVSEMERGNKTTSFERLVILCEHYNITADYLLGLTDEARSLTAKEKEGIEA